MYGNCPPDGESSLCEATCRKKEGSMNRDERAKLLKDRKEPLRKEPFWCKDSWRDLDVYRVPVDALLLNADNRRFAAEKKLMEEKVGHALDPENNPADELSIISILLDAGLDVDGD